jgi:hypothetical protein
MPGKKRGKGKRKGGKSGKSGRSHGGGHRIKNQTKHSTTVVPGLMIPSETDVRLKEQVNGQMVSAGVGGAAEHFYLNSMYHTAPSVLAVIPGLSQYIGWYNYYRVVRAMLSITYYNMEVFPVQLTLMFTNLDPGTAYNNYRLFQGNPLVYSFTLGAKSSGKDMKTFTKKITMSEIVGTGNVETDDTFRAAIGNDPVDFLWFGHSVFALGGNTLTANNGVIYEKKVTRLSRFYSRAELANYRKDEFQFRKEQQLLWDQRTQERRQTEMRKSIAENTYVVVDNTKGRFDEVKNDLGNTSNGKEEAVFNWRQAYLKGHLKDQTDVSEVEELILQQQQLQLLIDQKLKF